MGLRFGFARVWGWFKWKGLSRVEHYGNFGSFSPPGTPPQSAERSICRVDILYLFSEAPDTSPGLNPRRINPSLERESIWKTRNCVHVVAQYVPKRTQTHAMLSVFEALYCRHPLSLYILDHFTHTHPQLGTILRHSLTFTTWSFSLNFYIFQLLFSVLSIPLLQVKLEEFFALKYIYFFSFFFVHSL